MKTKHQLTKEILKLEYTQNQKSYRTIAKENNILNTKQAHECLNLWDTNNGRTLCTDCHKKTDTWGYKSYKILYGTK